MYFFLFSDLTEEKKSLPPREDDSVASGSTFHPSDLTVATSEQSSQQDVVQLKNAHELTNTVFNEIEPSDKNTQAIYTAVRIDTEDHQNFIQLYLDTCSIGYREEIVVTGNDGENLPVNDNENRTYIPG